ncbi:MAG: hypothetical protein ACQEUN_03970 [Pseudomonadota bacterium]
MLRAPDAGVLSDIHDRSAALLQPSLLAHDSLPLDQAEPIRWLCLHWNPHRLDCPERRIL